MLKKLWNDLKEKLTNFDNVDKFYVLMAIYSATYTFTPILSGGRDINFFGYPLMPGSLLALLNLSIIAIVQQNYGKDPAKKMVVGGILARIAVWSFTMFTLMLPELHKVQGYDEIVSSGFRVLVAGSVARYITQIFIDIPIFQKLKDSSKSFSLCYITAMLLDITIGRSIFLILAKWGTPGPSLVDRFVAHFAISVIFVILLTPLVTGLNHLLFKKEPNA